MKKSNILTILILSFSPLFGQEREKLVGHIGEATKRSVGFEILGGAGLYSVVYNERILQKGNYALEIRPQLCILPGSVEGSIPNFAVPVFGFNNRWGKKLFSFNADLSAGVAFNWGVGHYSPRMISSIAVGPKLRMDFMTIGASYVFFFREPEYFSFQTFPHSFGVSFEFEIGRSERDEG